MPRKKKSQQPPNPDESVNIPVRVIPPKPLFTPYARETLETLRWCSEAIVMYAYDTLIEYGLDPREDEDLQIEIIELAYRYWDETLEKATAGITKLEGTADNDCVGAELLMAMRDAGRKVALQIVDEHGLEANG